MIIFPFLLSLGHNTIKHHVHFTVCDTQKAQTSRESSHHMSLISSHPIFFLFLVRLVQRCEVQSIEANVFVQVVASRFVPCNE